MPKKKSKKKLKSKKVKKKPFPGDLVEVKLVKKSYKGRLLEAPKDDKGIVLLKLDSGYNIGFRKSKVLSVSLLGKAKDEKEDFEKPKHSKDKPNIAMIITGGTIASRLDSKTGGVDPLTEPEDLFRYYPEMFNIVNVVKVERPFLKASEDMDSKDWKKLARVAKKHLNDSNIKGVIVTHGTDFLHYTGAALSFMLKDLNKPVVLTYSQRSIDRASSDANLNLQCAALAAVSDIAEVMLVGHATTEDTYCLAMPATKTRKMHTSRRDAFKVVNGEPFAKIYPDKIIPLREYNVRKKGKNKVKTDTAFEEKVSLIKVYPGQNPDILNYYKKKKYKGLILEVSGLGHVPVKARKGWLKKLKEVQGKGMVICAAAQTIYGRLDPWVYSNGREIEKTGVIYLEDMLSETAFVKLGYVLAKTNKKEEIKKLMLTNMAHELNNRLEN